MELHHSYQLTAILDGVNILKYRTAKDCWGNARLRIMYE